jgi:hypothetical protein
VKHLPTASQQSALALFAGSIANAKTALVRLQADCDRQGAAFDECVLALEALDAMADDANPQTASGTACFLWESLCEEAAEKADPSPRDEEDPRVSADREEA